MPSPLQYDETTLLARIAEGDEAAFNVIFERYRDKLYHYMLKITKLPEISEEIVMDVFMKLWFGRELLSNIRQLEGFLHKVAYYKAIDFLRVTSRQSRLQEAYAKRMEKEPEKRADELMIDEEMRQLLYNAIKQLPPKRKLIYKLSREKGLTHDQIAEALHLSRNTVKNNIVSANKSISDFLRNSDIGRAAFSVLFLFL